MAFIEPFGALPTELLNLLALHTSFLTSLSLHYAHNGTASPVDLRTLTASVTMNWRQREVTQDDIRLCIGVLSRGPAAINNPFYISDYGRGKIYLELKDDFRINAGTTMNEDALKTMFMDALDYLWKQWSTLQQMTRTTGTRAIATPKKRGRPRKLESKQNNLQFYIDEHSLSKFIAQLPLIEITVCGSLVAVAPLQEKGRKRLRDVQDSVQQGRSHKKAREAIGKENELVQEIKMQPTQMKMTEFATVRKNNLLERILAKQTAAKSSKCYSPAELQRKAALQRSEEVLRVLSLLCASRGPSARVSFSVPALVQSLQNSVRTPLSKDEVLKCIEVLASDVAPGYVSMMKMGPISSVIINQAMRPINVKERLAAVGVA